MADTAKKSITSETADLACEACAALRETLRMCIGALSKYYADELRRNDPKELGVSDLVRGGVVLRAERALRTPCTCGETALLDLAY
jgi:hypothetical protein